MKSHSVLQEMLYGPLFLAALFCCMFSKSKAYATDVKIVNLKQGGNAELKLPQRQLHLNSFTVCSSVFPIYSARLSFPILTMNIHNESLIFYAYSVISYGRWVIGVEIYKGGRPIINGAANSIVFPLQWVTFCLSMDLVSGTLRLTLDSQLAVDEAHEDFVFANTSSTPISFHLGATNDKKSSRRVSNLNMFSSALPLEKMKRITKAGTSECGAPGDLLSWEQTNLTFSGTSTLLRVDPREGPCFARRSPLLVSSGEFSQPECMKHCRKLGTISPPVQTLSQWQNLKKELSAFQEQAVYKDTDTGYSRRIWLPPTTGENGDYGVKNLDHWPENVVAQADIWRDYYTGEPTQTVSTSLNSSNENWYNCIYTSFTRGSTLNVPWTKFYCTLKETFSCTCQSQKEPLVLRLLGLPFSSNLRGVGSDRMQGVYFTPRQSLSDPSNMFFVSRRGSQIEFNEAENIWIMSDTATNSTALSKSSKSSHVLGKHNWTILANSGAVTFHLKLTACSNSNLFTCDDGTCISMESRCDHVLDCFDRFLSDQSPIIALSCQSLSQSLTSLR